MSSVSIGLPVYNGAQYIREAIESVLGQTHEDFELIISDNASTDSTAAICSEYAARDPRIVYIRQPHNIGASANFTFVAEQARGRLFTWLAHDDLLSPTYLEVMQAFMSGHPGTVLASSDFIVVDADGNPIDTRELESMRERIPWPRRRLELFKYPIAKVYFCIYGLMRTDACVAALRALPDMSQIAGMEFPILSRLSMVGEINALPMLLRTYRLHAVSGYFSEVAAQAKLPRFTRFARVNLHINDIRRDQLRVINDSDLSRLTKAGMFARLAAFYARRFSIKLALAPMTIARSFRNHA